MLRAATDALQAHRNELLDLAVANGGNTRGDAKFDVDGAIFTLAAYADLGKALGATRVLVDGEGIPLGRSPRFHGQHVQVPAHRAWPCTSTPSTSRPGAWRRRRPRRCSPACRW